MTYLLTNRGLTEKEKIVETKNREKIDSAAHGSDIYGILEKIAYHLHLRHEEGTELENWDKAKWVLSGSLNPFLDGVSDFPEEEIKGSLKCWASKFSRLANRTDLENWVMALDKYALKVLEHFDRGYRVSE